MKIFVYLIKILEMQNCKTEWIKTIEGTAPRSFLGKVEAQQEADKLQGMIISTI